jgi:hypothetical protein
MARLEAALHQGQVVRKFLHREGCGLSSGVENGEEMIAKAALYNTNSPK